ncbi:ABC transporter ATP-binding protein [Microbacterium sp. STN6]|uniref:ABC transporter ATP-binding protein n=1 Tax=Microbacterium sp. STN6 TaxID=2995588 RepID=UPI002260D9AB|nr:ABC transporter ATP-binding protein [Microbacterium sp. STN6]MCX7523299.1 ABC transporter ATP-binding protein [Microbacterium sp. STN6]
MLTVTSLSRAFGGVYATKDVSVTVPEGELRGVIGPNGAGKSTLFNLIGGHLRANAGSIEFGGARVDRLPVHRRARLGIAIVFQGARLFPEMSVLENVMVGANAATRAGAVAAALRLPSQRNEERGIRQRAFAALGRVGLAAWAERDAEALPLGQQRRLQVARALMGEPRLLLLDEPASGLRAAEREDLSELITELHREGMTIMLIEHDVSMVMRLADKITVLDLGEVIAEGTPAEIRRNQRVIDAYLGGEAAHADAE